MKIKNALGGQIGILKSTVIAILLAGSAFKSGAQTYNLSTGDSSVQINGGSSPAVSDWTAAGVTEMPQQAFYYSVGSGNVNSIDTINSWTLLSQSATALSGTYVNSTLGVTNTYSLQDEYNGSTELSALTTTISLQNVSDSSQTFHFYQYSDFTIGGTPAGQDVEFTGTGFPYTVYQFNPNNIGEGFLEGNIAIGLGVTVGEVAGINDGTDFGLGENVPAPNFNSTDLTAGPGPVDFGYEFTATLAPLSSITITETQTVPVPEPSSMALISLGILALGMFKGRRLAFKR